MFERLVPPALADAAQDHLRQDGVQHGSIVAWLGLNSWDLLATLVACERLGAVLLPLNTRLAPAELAHILSHAGAGHLMGTPEMAPLAADVLGRVALTPGPAPGVQADDLLLVYTSGSTGAPKGAMHTRRGMQANVLAAVAAQGLDAGTRVLAVLPLFHVGGLCIQTLPALAVGAKVQLHPRFDVDAWFDSVKAWRPTTTLLVPAVMRALIEHPRWAQADLSSLSFVNSGSQIVPRHLIDAFHARGVPVAQVYGATETGPVSIVLRPGEALAYPGMAGRPALGVQVRLGEQGEIHLRGANLMRAYHRQEGSALDAQGWFATGDLALRHAHDLYEVVGRRSELIISGGENIYPAEIENLLAGRPELADCAVIGWTDPRWGEVPVLALVARAGQTIDERALDGLFSAHLARFKHPRRIVALRAIPRTALGKLKRQELLAELRACHGPSFEGRT